jgi:predicted enzyme related to lactoylglutathione lyase
MPQLIGTSAPVAIARRYRAGVERVTGIGGVFFRAKAAREVHQWYSKHLGVPEGEYGAEFTSGEGGASLIWTPFPADTDYFGPSGQQWMVNYRVRDLDAMLQQLRDAGVEVLPDTQELDGVGRFGWAVDPEGHRFELWEPAPED